jgi:hypothetical protein
MKKKSMMIVVTATICLFGVAALASPATFLNDVIVSVKNVSIAVFSSSEAEPEPQETVQTPRQIVASEVKSEIPEYVLYETVFQMVFSISNLAREQEANGEAVTVANTYFTDEAKLSQQDNDFLALTANSYNEEIKIIDAEAEVEIKLLQKQFLTKSDSDQPLIKPSAHLLELQEQRNKLALKYREQLGNLLGEEKFREFDRFVKKDFASGFKTLPLSPLPNADQEGGSK